MKNFSYFIFLPLFLLMANRASAQSADYFMYPRPLDINEFNSSIGVGLVGLPEDQAEEASTMIRAPLLNYQVLFGLPSDFQLYGAAHTNIATFHFTLGPKWRLNIGNFALALGYDFAYWFGKLEQYGFNSEVRGWSSYPNLTLGYDFARFAVSVKGTLIILNSLDELQDDIEISTDYETVSGGSLGFYIEQPLWKNNYLLLGFKINYTKFYYPTWALYTTFNRYLYIPEFILGFNL